MKPRFALAALPLAFITVAPHADAATRIRNNAAADLNTIAAWDDGVTAIPTSADTAVWNSTSAGGAQTLGGDSSWGGILISAGAPSSVQFTNAANPSTFTLTLGGGGIDLNEGASTNRGISFESNTLVALGANQTWKLGNGGTPANITVASVVSGAFSLEVTRTSGASNYAQLGGLNTFSGGLTIGSNAWLRLANSTAATTSGTAVTASPTGTTTLTLNDGALVTSDGGTTRNIANTQINLLGNVTFNQASGGTGRLQVAGVWDLGGSPRTVTINKPSASFGSGQEGIGLQSPAGFAAPRFQNGALTLATTAGTSTNPAILRFTTAAFSSNGALNVGDGVAIVSQNGAFFAAGADSPALTLAAPDTRGGGVIQLGDGGATMRGAQVYSLAGGGSISASNTTGTPAQTGTITVNHGNGAVFSGNISQGGTGIIAFTKTGTGTQTLSGTNSYTGKTTISGGVLEFGKQVSLYNNTPASWTDANIQVDSGATLALNVGGTGEFTDADVTTLAAIGTGTSGFRNGSRIGLDTTNASGGTFTYSSVLANPNAGANALGLRKLGTGTLVLDQANTFTGGTFIDGGTLKVTQPAALGTTSGTVTVAAGTTLDADFSGLGAAGTINRTITGSGTVNATSANTFQLSFSSGILTTFTGTVNVKPSPASNARVDFNGFLGSGATVNIETGATARLVGTGTYSSLTVNVAGTGGSGPGALRLQDNTLDSSCTVTLTADASIGSFAPAVSTIATAIAETGGARSLTKAGSSTLNLTVPNTYTGNTNVTGGTLSLGDGSNNTALANTADVTVASGATLDLNYSGTDIIDELTINGVQKAAGVWGSLTSGAPNTDPQLTGTGTLQVTTGPSPSSAFDIWASSFSLTGPNAAFDFDFDNDGLDNGLEWILGGNPTTNSASVAPAATRNLAGDLVLTFNREEDAIPETVLTLEYDTTLDGSFANSFVIDTDGGTDANGVTVSINQAANPDAVTIQIPSSVAPSGKVFARLKAVRIP